MQMSDLLLVAETEELLMEKLWKWKKGIEMKGLKVNIGKTKVMRCQLSRGQDNFLVVFTESVGRIQSNLNIIARLGVGCSGCNTQVAVISNLAQAIIFLIEIRFVIVHMCTL